MERFIAMMWRPEVPGAAGRVRAWAERLALPPCVWRTCLSRPGLLLLTRGQTRTAPFENSEGAIVGVIFERHREKSGALKRIDATCGAQVRASVGASLTRDYWGGYVALWRDTTGATHLLRDPGGELPCYLVECEGVVLAFSHIDDVTRLPGLSWRTDWRYLTSFLVFNYFVTRHTALEGVDEILPGERLTVDAEGRTLRAFVWNAARIASQPDIGSDFAEAATEVRETTEAVVGALARHDERVLISLSGGLDSSILVTLLAQSREVSVSALHYAHPSYEADELRFARAAAEHAGIELIEATLDPLTDSVESILEGPLLARPRVQKLGALIDEISVANADRLGARAFVLGHGGDNVFLAGGAFGHTFSDAVRMQGLTPSSMHRAYEAAVVSQQPLASVIARTLGSLATPYTPFQVLRHKHWREHRLVREAAFKEVPASYLVHPWLLEARSLPHGKGEHLSSLVALYNYTHDFGRGLERPVRHPFASQPLLEFALKTPTYLFTDGGAERALQRAAFSDLLPDAIRRRRMKGGADHYSLQVLKAHLPFFRSLILDGELIKRDLLEAKKVEAMLEERFVLEGGGALFVYLLAAGEAWLQSWKPFLNPASSER